jgi:hypothetical protein
MAENNLAVFLNLKLLMFFEFKLISRNEKSIHQIQKTNSDFIIDHHFTNHIWL